MILDWIMWSPLAEKSMLLPDLRTCNEMHLHPNVKRITTQCSFIFIKLHWEVQLRCILYYWGERKEKVMVLLGHRCCQTCQTYLGLFSLSTWDGVVSVFDVLFISPMRLTCQFENNIYRKSLRKCDLMFKMVQHHFSDHGDKLLMALILQDTVQFRVFTIVCILWDKRLYNMDMYLASVGRGKPFYRKRSLINHVTALF